MAAIGLPGWKRTAPTRGVSIPFSLNAIPDDALKIIFSVLDARDRARLACVCLDWDILTAPDSSAWEDINVTLRPLSGDSRSTEAVDRAPFLDWLEVRVDVLRRVQILTCYRKASPGRGEPEGASASQTRQRTSDDFKNLSNELLAVLAEAPRLSHCQLRGWLPGFALEELSQLPPSLVSLNAFIEDQDGPDEVSAPEMLGSAISHLIHLTSLEISWKGEVGYDDTGLWHFPVGLSALTALQNLFVDWRHPDQTGCLDEVIFGGAQRLTWKHDHQASAAEVRFRLVSGQNLHHSRLQERGCGQRLCLPH